MLNQDYKEFSWISKERFFLCLDVSGLLAYICLRIWGEMYGIKPG